MNLVDELSSIAAEIPYAVCGGLAVSAHGAPRAKLVGREHVMVDLLVQSPPLPEPSMTASSSSYRRSYLDRLA